jgi:hypothetical protein
MSVNVIALDNDAKRSKDVEMPREKCSESALASKCRGAVEFLLFPCSENETMTFNASLYIDETISFLSTDLQKIHLTNPLNSVLPGDFVVHDSNETESLICRGFVLDVSKGQVTLLNIDWGGIVRCSSFQTFPLSEEGRKYPALGVRFCATTDFQPEMADLVWSHIIKGNFKTDIIDIVKVKENR